MAAALHLLDLEGQILAFFDLGVDAGFHLQSLGDALPIDGVSSWFAFFVLGAGDSNITGAGACFDVGPIGKVARVRGEAELIGFVREQPFQRLADDVLGPEAVPAGVVPVQVRLHESQDIKALLVGVQDVPLQIAQQGVGRRVFQDSHKLLDTGFLSDSFCDTLPVDRVARHVTLSFLVLETVTSQVQGPVLMMHWYGWLRGSRALR